MVEKSVFRPATILNWLVGLFDILTNARSFCLTIFLMEDDVVVE